MTAQLPTSPRQQLEMVETIAGWIDRLADKLSSEAGRNRLRDAIRASIGQGTLPTLRVIAAAHAGFSDADIALREMIAEKLDRREELPTSLQAYAQEALFHGPVPNGPGRHLTDTYIRDIGIAVLVVTATSYWPSLPATRNRASKHPSACQLVSEALGRRGFNIGERRVEKISGEIHQMAGRLSALIPVH
jgi:hypothetical protein